MHIRRQWPRLRRKWKAWPAREFGGLGANDTRITSNLVIARYDHDTSRELDPQIHSHLVAANLTYDGVEGNGRLSRRPPSTRSANTSPRFTGTHWRAK